MTTLKTGKRTKEVGLGVGLMPLMALMAPFAIWGMERVVPLGVLGDEGFKALMVGYIVPRMERRVGLLLVVMCGFLFAGSKLIVTMVSGSGEEITLSGLGLVLVVQLMTVGVWWWGWSRGKLSWAVLGVVGIRMLVG
jgi:hypothetical protein